MRVINKKALTKVCDQDIIVLKFLKIKSLIERGGGTRPSEARQPKSKQSLLLKVPHPTDPCCDLKDKRRNC